MTPPNKDSMSQATDCVQAVKQSMSGDELLSEQHTAARLQAAHPRKFRGFHSDIKKCDVQNLELNDSLQAELLDGMHCLELHIPGLWAHSNHHRPSDCIIKLLDKIWHDQRTEIHYCLHTAPLRCTHLGCLLHRQSLNQGVMCNLRLQEHQLALLYALHAYRSANLSW